MFREFNWNNTEKKIARQVFDAALDDELAEVLATFKARAAAAETIQDMWAVHEYLDKIGPEIDRKYDYRYSQLPIVFAVLLREQRIEESDLAGLSEDKLEFIRSMASA